MEIPSVSHHVVADKAGYLNKLSGRSFPYIPQWRRRYCVLTHGKLYYYERHDSKGTDKNNGVINLEYFDQIYEAPPKDCKKATNVFVLTSQDRSFFDPGRHYFSAETLSDLHDWVRKIRHSLDQIRNNNRPTSTKSTSSSSSNSNFVKKSDEQNKGIEEEKQEQQSDSRTSTRERKKKKQESKGSPAQNCSRVRVTKSHYEEQPPDLKNTSLGDSKIQRKVPLVMEGLLGMGGRTPDVKEIKMTTKEDDFDLPSETQRLESITKRRPRPNARKLPSKRTTLAKQRASSLSALYGEETAEVTGSITSPQEGAPTVNRSTTWLNRSVDLLEEEKSRKIQNKMRRSAHAYNYSSDETDDDLSQSDSFSTSASGFAPQPPPRMSSYASSTQPPIPGPKPLPPIIPLGSLPSLHETGQIDPFQSEWRGSVCSMGASPVMDDLDNFLMNESVQAATPLDSPSSAGGSEISTCKAVGEPAPKSPTPDNQMDRMCSSKFSDGYSCRENNKGFVENETLSAPEMNKFTITAHHLQTHIVDLDHDIQGLSSDLGEMRTDVSTLQQSMSIIKSDAERVGETVTILSKEAARASRQIVSAAQEAEKTQKLASLALQEAETTKGEYKKLKKEYEEIVAELKTTLLTLKAGANAQKHKLSLDNSSSCHNYQSLERKKHSSKTLDSSSQIESQKGTKEHTSTKEEGSHKLSGYQSLFIRPSSIISGLASRASLAKSVSFADQSKKKKESDENKKDKKDKKEELKDKEDKKYFSSLERKQKNKSVDQVSDNSKVLNNEKTSKEVNILRQKPKTKKYFSAAEKAMSNETLDDIPMMDENLERSERPRSSIGFTKFSSISNSNEINFDLGKSSSSPSVSDQNQVLRPKILDASQKPCQTFTTYSTYDSKPPELNNPSNKPIFSGYSINNNVPTSPSNSLTSLYRPNSACGQLKRQSSMSTVPEDQAVNTLIQPALPPVTSKPRVFAIHRQNSTPNLPIQRQNSNPSIPLQRQYSLGTVQEENKLSRQDSILSVPEDRPIVDQTLPNSPSGSIQCLPTELLPDRGSIRNSLELVTGPIISGTSFQMPGFNQQISYVNNIPDDPPMATSSLKKKKSSISIKAQ